MTPTTTAGTSAAKVGAALQQLGLSPALAPSLCTPSARHRTDVPSQGPDITAADLALNLPSRSQHVPVRGVRVLLLSSLPSGECALAYPSGLSVLTLSRSPYPHRKPETKPHPLPRSVSQLSTGLTCPCAERHDGAGRHQHPADGDRRPGHRVPGGRARRAGVQPAQRAVRAHRRGRRPQAVDGM